MQPQEIIFDLSGKAGLADGFFGDSDMVVPQPQLRNARDGEMVSGFYNPYLRDGYMAPTTTTSVSVTTDQTTTQIISSFTINRSAGTVYMTSNEGQIFTGDTLSDTSFTRIQDLRATASMSAKTICDTELYEINGIPTLYLAQSINWLHSSVEMRRTRIYRNPRRAATNGYVNFHGAFNPTATLSESPRLVYSNVIRAVGDSQVALSDEDDNPIYIPTGRGNLGAVIIAIDTRENSVGTNRTFDATVGWSGVTQASIEAFDNQTVGALRVSGRAYSIYNITPGLQGDIIVNLSGDSNDAVVFILVYDNCLQSGSMFTATEGFNISTGSPSSVATISQPGGDSAANQTLVSMIMTPMGSDTSLRHSARDFWQRPLFNLAGSVVGSNETGLYSVWEIEKSPARAVLGTMSIPGHTVESQWSIIASSEVAEKSTSDHIFLRKADNGFMYFFRDNAVDSIDGSVTGGNSGSYNKNVLLFPDYFRISDALDYRSRMFIAIQQYPVAITTTSLNNFNGSCGIYVWNRISTQLSSSDYIELPGVREIKKIYASPDGVLKLLTISDSGLTELRQFGYNDSGGVVFPVVKTLGLGAHPQLPSGCLPIGDKTVWLGNDGTLYSEKNNAVVKLFQAKAAGTGTTGVASNIKAGAIMYGSVPETSGNSFRTNKQSILLTYLDGSTPTFKKIYPFDLTTGSDGAQTPLAGDVYTGVKYIPIGSNVRTLRIYNAPISGSGTDVIATVKLYFNQSTTATLPSGMTKSITKNEAKRGYVDFAINSHNVHSVQIEVEWATGTAIGADMYLPSTAVVLVEPTKAQGPDND